MSITDLHLMFMDWDENEFVSVKEYGKELYYGSYNNMKPEIRNRKVDMFWYDSFKTLTIEVMLDT